MNPDVRNIGIAAAVAIILAFVFMILYFTKSCKKGSKDCSQIQNDYEDLKKSYEDLQKDKDRLEKSYDFDLGMYGYSNGEGGFSFGDDERRFDDLSNPAQCTWEGTSFQYPKPSMVLLTNGRSYDNLLRLCPKGKYGPECQFYMCPDGTGDKWVENHPGWAYNYDQASKDCGVGKICQPETGKCVPTN